MSANDTDGQTPGRWPGWVRAVVSGLLGFHLAAIGAGAFATPPMSPLQQDVAGLFAWYYALVDQGYSYRYYAPEPPPTPVVEARLLFDDGRPDQVVRLPDREARPRMLYQRQLALANSLFVEHNEQRRIPANLPPELRPAPRWGPSYARHLGRVHGCSEVALSVTMHLIPPVDRVQRALEDPAEGPIDLDAEEFLSVPELIGVYPCDAS